MTLRITRNSIGETHEKLVSYIRKYGSIIQTEGEEATKEITDISITITNPFDEPRISSYCFMGKKGFDEYADNIINGYQPHVKFIYDYHKRLFDWGGGTQDDGIVTYTGNSPSNSFYVKGKTNQIEYIVEKLKKNITSRRALAVTWIPPVDEFRDDVPCLQLVQFLIRNNKLEMFVIFRSEDILSAYGQNVYGLTMLQKDIANQLNVQTGDYHHYIVCGHIYYIRDSHELDKFPDVD